MLFKQVTKQPVEGSCLEKMWQRKKDKLFPSLGIQWNRFSNSGNSVKIVDELACLEWESVGW